MARAPSLLCYDLSEEPPRPSPPDVFVTARWVPDDDERARNSNNSLNSNSFAGPAATTSGSSPDGGDPGDPFDGGDEERFSPLHFALSAQADSAALFLLEVRSTLATLATLATTWPAHMDT